MKASAIGAAILAVLITVFAYAFFAPVITCVVAGAPFTLDTLETMFSVEHWTSFWVSGEWFGHVLYIPLFATFVFLCGFLYFFSQASKYSRDVQDGVYGGAHIIKAKSELKRKNDHWNGKGTPKSAGLVLGCDKSTLYYDKAIPFGLTVGKTGSGKTQLQVLQTLSLCMAAGWNIISTGKEEVLELTREKAEELGYQVVVLDLAGYPGASSYNPLELVIDYIEHGNLAAATKCARQIASDLVPISPGEKQPYFPKSARKILAACILAVCTEDIPREQKNLSSVARLIAEGTSGEDPQNPAKRLKDYVRSLGYEHPAYKLSVGLMHDGGETNAGKNVMETLDNAISIFSDEDLCSVTSRNDISIRQLIEQKSVVYIQMLDEGDPYSVVYACFLDQWYRVANEVKRAHGGRLPHETALVLDELGNLGMPIHCLPSIITLGRAAKIHAYIWIQNLAQLNVYDGDGGRDAGRDKILGSIGQVCALALSAPSDCQWFSAKTGQMTVRSQGQSNTSGSNGLNNSSLSMTETGQPLIRPEEWQYRVPVRDGLICIKGGENAAPGHEGTFEFPVIYANKTPAGPFFDLGDQEYEEAKRRKSYRKAMMLAGKNSLPVPKPWCPDFTACKSDTPLPDLVDAQETEDFEQDEWGAWD